MDVQNDSIWALAVNCMSHVIHLTDWLRGFALLKCYVLQFCYDLSYFIGSYRSETHSDNKHYQKYVIKSEGELYFQTVLAQLWER